MSRHWVDTKVSVFSKRKIRKICKKINQNKKKSALNLLMFLLKAPPSTDDFYHNYYSRFKSCLLLSFTNILILLHKIWQQSLRKSITDVLELENRKLKQQQNLRARAEETAPTSESGDSSRDPQSGSRQKDINDWQAQRLLSRDALRQVIQEVIDEGTDQSARTCMSGNDEALGRIVLDEAWHLKRVPSENEWLNFSAMWCEWCSIWPIAFVDSRPVSCSRKSRVVVLPSCCVDMMIASELQDGPSITPFWAVRSSRCLFAYLPMR